MTPTPPPKAVDAARTRRDGADGIRQRYTAFIARHETAWELSFAALAILFVGVGFAADGVGPAAQPVLEGLDLTLTGVFLAEFLTRLWAAPVRREYLRGHWIDLVALVPVVRGVRVFRLVRLLRLVRAFAGVGRALARMQRLARHQGLVWLFAAWSGVMVLCSLGLYAAENGVNRAIESPLDALWWGITTMTTVGYGDVTPVTPEGRIAAAILMILGIGLYSAITATLTSFLLAGPRDGDLEERIRRALREELEEARRAGDTG